MKKALYLSCALLYSGTILLSCSPAEDGQAKTYKRVVDYSDYAGAARSVACVGGGVVYLSNGSNAIYRIGADGISSVFSSNGVDPDTYVNPVGIAIDGSGNLYVANDLDFNIIKITPAGVPSVYIGDTGNPGNSNTPPVSFNRPYGAAYDIENDVLYVGDSMNSRIRKVECANANATSDFASFGFVYSVKLDAEGNVYASSGADKIVKKYSPAGAELATYTFTATDDPQIYDIAIARDGTLYALDYGNSVVWRVDTEGTITLFAGIVGTAGHDNGPLLSATFDSPSGIAIDGNGTIYIADGTNPCIRKIALE